jgi:hypothetical protein
VVVLPEAVRRKIEDEEMERRWASVCQAGKCVGFCALLGSCVKKLRRNAKCEI